MSDGSSSACDGRSCALRHSTRKMDGPPGLKDRASATVEILALEVDVGDLTAHSSV